MVDVRPLAAALLLALVLAGCGDGTGEPVKIDWDLSRSHTVGDVEFVEPELTANEIKPIESVRIRLPEGKVFTADGEVVHDVSLDREGEQLVNLQIDSEPLETDQAYELALGWAREFDLPPEPIEKWHEKRVEAREAGAEDVTSTTLTTPKPGVTIGPGGPEPYLQIRYSFNDEIPSIASLQFFWKPDRSIAGSAP